MTRRHFLPVAAGAVAGTTLLGYYAWDQADAATMRRQCQQTPQTFSKAQLPQEARQILYLASLAPSGHNTQPWTVRLLGPYHWVIGNNARCWLPVVDPTQRETVLALGAFVQNLEYAAASFGYACSWQLRATAPQESEVLEVKLARQHGATYDSLPDLLHRRTLRGEFAPVVVQPTDLRHLIAANAEHCCFVPPYSPEGGYLADTTLAAFRQQTTHEAAQRELAHWVRWRRTEVEQHRDGLTAASLGINGVAGWAVRHFYDSTSVLTPSFRQRSLDKAAHQTAAHGGWLLLTGKNDSVAGLLDAGRRLEQLWLRARGCNVAVHPMSQVLEEPAGPEALAARLGLGEPVQFVLRVGYVDHYPAPVSVRRPVEWFVRADRPPAFS